MDANLIREQFGPAIEAACGRSGERLMQYGVDDCALWVADIQSPILGYDPAAKVRGAYKSRRGALRFLGERGLLHQLRRIARRHQWKVIRPANAQPGDTGLAWTYVETPAIRWETDVDDNEKKTRRPIRYKKQVPTLATVICRAPGWFVGRNEGGFTALRADHVAIAWSVLPDAIADEPGAPINLRRIPLRPDMCPTGATSREPISIGTAILGLIGVTGASSVVAGIVGGVALAAVSVGVSLVASLLRPQQGVGDLSNSGISKAQSVQSVQITERQPIPIKRVIVGSAYVGGALCFEKVTPPYLTTGVLVNYGKIAGIDKLFIGTNQVAFDAITPNMILTPMAVIDQPNYPSRLKVSFRYGEMDQSVDPLVYQEYPEVGTDFRQSGVATAFYRYHFGADQNQFIALWGQVQRPNAYLVVRGISCYDPRDPLQDMNDESTWKWTNNATLVQAFYLTRSWGGRIPMARVRWDKIATSADYDDELIGCNDGTMIKRHTIDGVITMNQRPYDVMLDLLTANRAMLIDAGGSVWIESSKPRTSIATIHDRILAGGIKWTGARAKSDLVNKLQVRFVSPDQEYQLADGPILDRADLQETDGEVLPATLALKYTQDHRRAQRLQKLFLLSSRLGKTITCSVDMSLLAIAAENAGEELIGSVVTVDSQLFSKMNGLYLVTAVSFSDDCTTLSLALAQYDPTLENQWNPEIDEQPFETSLAA